MWSVGLARVCLLEIAVWMPETVLSSPPGAPAGPAGPSQYVWRGLGAKHGARDHHHSGQQANWTFTTPAQLMCSWAGPLKTSVLVWSPVSRTWLRTSRGPSSRSARTRQSGQGVSPGQAVSTARAAEVLVEADPLVLNTPWADLALPPSWEKHQEEGQRGRKGNDLLKNSLVLGRWVVAPPTTTDPPRSRRSSRPPHPPTPGTT